MGRPSKGNRVLVATRLPPREYTAVASEAHRRGMNVSDWLLWAVNTVMGVSRTYPTVRDPK